MRQMTLDFDILLSTVSTSITLVENTLAGNKKIQFEDIKTEIDKYEEEYGNIEFIIGDVEEQPIEFPTKNQEDYYSGKKKMHALKNKLL